MPRHVGDGLGVVTMRCVNMMPISFSAGSTSHSEPGNSIFYSSGIMPMMVAVPPLRSIASDCYDNHAFPILTLHIGER
jgi:hypothetical protein